MLARQDGIIRELFKERRFTLAVRDASFRDGQIDIAEIFQAFLSEGKLPQGMTNFEESPEIGFIGKHAVALPWSFDDVRISFTHSCRSIIASEFSKILDQPQMATLEEWIEIETQRDKGAIGRAFLQNKDRLPQMFETYGIMPMQEARNLLIKCTDAVYLSNLPKTIGLDPIYTEHHRPSFQLLRNFDYELRPVGDPKPLKDKLHWTHFKAGLNRLDLDDINHLHQSDAFKDFNELSKSDNIIASFDTLFEVYCELNMLIEDRIIQRFPEIARSSPAPTPRQLRAKYGTAIDRGKTLIGDVLAIGMDFAGKQLVSIPFSGIFTDLVVDAVKSKVIPERPLAVAATRERQKQQLRTFLEDKGAADVIEFDEEYVTTSSFAKETIVR